MLLTGKSLNFGRMSGPGHHVTQRFHLSHFAGHDPKGEVWIYDKKTGSMRSDAPEAIGVENHFYSIEREDGSWDSALDDLITSIEGDATPVYRRLLAKDIPALSQAKYDFSVYLALTYKRTRTQRRIASDMYGKMLQSSAYTIGMDDQAFGDTIKQYEEERGTPLTEEQKREMRDLLIKPADEVIYSIAKNKTFETWGMMENLAELFLRMEWSIVEPEHGFYVTSDNPLLHQVAEGPMAFQNKTVNVSFPLSYNKMLLLTHNKHPRSIWQTPRAYVDAANRARASHCERELYAHIKHRDILKMAVRFKNERLGVEFDGMGPEKFADVVSPRRFNK